MSRTSAVAFAVLFALGGAGTFAGEFPTAYAQDVPSINLLPPGTFTKPNVGSPAGTTTFSPVSSDNLFKTRLLARMSQNSQKQTMQPYVDQMFQMVEKAYTDYGYEKNDAGVAFGGFLETCWEISNGTFKIGVDDAQDKAKTKTAVRQMQNALLASPAYKAIPDRSKQLLYEACTFATGNLTMQWQQAGSDASKKTAVQRTARQELRNLLGVEASALTRRPDGAFASVGGGVGSATTGKTAAAAHHSSSPPPVAARGPLPAASAHGAQIFVKYVFTGSSTRFDQLILFPDGAAFTDIPSKPVGQFDEATLRAALKPYDVGTWKQSGNTLVLKFPAKQHDATVTLRKVPRGWYDGTGKLDPDNSYDTYFPAVPLTPAQIAGPWKTESLTTMGFAGGAAPMVAHGSSGNRVYNANGTFAGGSESFTSATTANVGEGFKTGGDVGVYDTNRKKGDERWRLDGPLLTTDTGGKRSVALAFILPHWNKTGPPEILIDGDWWQRPKKK